MNVRNTSCALFPPLHGPYEGDRRQTDDKTMVDDLVEVQSVWCISLFVLDPEAQVVSVFLCILINTLFFVF